MVIREFLLSTPSLIDVRMFKASLGPSNNHGIVHIHIIVFVQRMGMCSLELQLLGRHGSDSPGGYDKLI